MTVGDLRPAARLLRGAFAEHGRTLEYSAAVLRLYWRWQWEPAGASLLAHDGELRAVACAGLRRVRFGGQALCALHLGPLAVRPDSRGRGLGSQLMGALEDQARQLGADLLCLCAEERFRAHHLYRRLGYEVVEKARTQVAIIDPRVVADALGQRWLAPLLGLLALGAPSAAADPMASEPARAARAGAIVEDVMPPLPPESGLPRARFAHGGAAISLLVWPVLAGDRRMGSAQVLRIRGSGAGLRTVIASAASWARRQGATTLYALGGIPSLPGFRTWGAPTVLRMAKGLSQAGKDSLAQAEAWDEWAPSP